MVAQFAKEERRMKQKKTVQVVPVTEGTAVSAFKIALTMPGDVNVKDNEDNVLTEFDCLLYQQCQAIRRQRA